MDVLPGPTARWRDGVQVGGAETEEHLGRSRTPEALVRPEAPVVCEESASLRSRSNRSKGGLALSLVIVLRVRKKRSMRAMEPAWPTAP